jgi:hypothetical protein
MAGAWRLKLNPQFRHFSRWRLNLEVILSRHKTFGPFLEGPSALQYLDWLHFIRDSHWKYRLVIFQFQWRFLLLLNFWHHLCWKLCVLTFLKIERLTALVIRRTQHLIFVLLRPPLHSRYYVLRRGRFEHGSVSGISLPRIGVPPPNRCQRLIILARLWLR